jgi:hypothetical protein
MKSAVRNGVQFDDYVEDFFFPQIICQFQLFSLILQLHLPVAAVRHTEVCRADGWSTTY